MVGSTSANGPGTHESFGPKAADTRHERLADITERQANEIVTTPAFVTRKLAPPISQARCAGCQASLAELRCHRDRL